MLQEIRPLTNLNAFVAFFAVFFVLNMYTTDCLAQQEVGIPFEAKEAFLLEFIEPFENLRVDIGKNEFGSDEIIDAEVASKASLFDHKENEIDPTDIHAGMEMVIQGEKLRKGFVIHFIKLKTKIDDWRVKIEGMYESYDKNTGIAEVGGQKVILEDGAIIDGADKWKKKKFPSFNNMMLGTPTNLEGRRDPDGLVYVTSGTTRPNLHGDSERALKLALKLVIKPIDASNELIVGIDSYKLVKDEGLQSYVQAIGDTLVPQWVKKIEDGQPDKIEFNFLVIDDPAFNAIAFPDGTVLVHTGLLKKLQNEAQLAAILGHEIAHVTNEHGQRRFDKQRKRGRARNMIKMYQELFEIAGERIDIPETVKAGDVEVNTGMFLKVGEGALSNIYGREQEDQADKVGLNYAVNAGYDPREAANVWKMLVDDVEVNIVDDADIIGALKERLRERTSSFLYSSHNEALVRFKHLNREIATNYSNVDFSALRIGEDEYKKATQSLR